MFQRSSSIRTTVAKFWYWVGPASITMSTPGKPAQRLGRRGDRLLGRGRTIVITSGAGRSRRTSRTNGCDGLRRATSPRRRDQRLDLARKATVKTVGHVAGEDQRRRPRPEPPGHSPADLRDPRHPVGHFLGTLEEQRQRARTSGPRSCLDPRHALGLSRHTPPGSRPSRSPCRRPRPAPGTRRRDGPRRAGHPPATRRSTAAIQASQSSGPAVKRPSGSALQLGGRAREFDRRSE